MFLVTFLTPIYYATQFRKNHVREFPDDTLGLIVSLIRVPSFACCFIVLSVFFECLSNLKCFIIALSIITFIFRSTLVYLESSYLYGGIPLLVSRAILLISCYLDPNNIHGYEFLNYDFRYCVISTAIVQTTFIINIKTFRYIYLYFRTWNYRNIFVSKVKFPSAQISPIS
ncbi:unnamed protein product [Caenorhabditis angaria]|uniref:Uncharacterized protein n=1 Tax=Caenorhabditis angaria TaxID=860376 RepID=A0A9P1IBL3_9PELO|nr:unnamed protein product [Caenorhabditis angaria]